MNRATRRRVAKLGGFLNRTRRGDGFGTEISVVTKPETGERVRITHRVDGKGQYAFDYPVDVASQMASDLVDAVRHARRRELDLERSVGR